jgi:hypothetical protein
MKKAYLHIRRLPYEEPYHTQLAIEASNGIFSGATDIYVGVHELVEIGKALKTFPARIGDEYTFRYGSEEPAANFYRFFMLRAYTVGSRGDCGLQIIMNMNQREPGEGICKFSIRSEPAAVNRLGSALEIFGELRHLELRWAPTESGLFKAYQD